MPVIHPSLFTVMRRFPDHKDALRQNEDSPTREKEYTVLLHELELEILKSLNGES